MSEETHAPAAHYDRVTDAWGLLLGDELHYGVFDSGDEPLPAATRRLTELMVEVSDLAPDLHVLDVGCGTGAPACAIATAHGVSVTGISTSAVGIDAATERAAALGLADHVSFLLRDGTANELPDASFDRVWALESSHLMRQREQLIAECARVLRPGGILTVCDIVLRRPMPFEEVRRLRAPLGVLRDVFGDAHMAELSSYAAWARDNGLEVTVEDDLTAATRPTFERWRANADAHRAEVEASLGAHGWSSFVEACDVLAAFWDDGTLGYGLLAAVNT